MASDGQSVINCPTSHLMLFFTSGSGTGTCTTCINCWKAPGEFLKDEFCSDSCREIIERRAPLLLDIPRGHSSFNDGMEPLSHLMVANPFTPLNSRKRIQERLERTQGSLSHDQKDLHGMHTRKAGGKSRRL